MDEFDSQTESEIDAESETVYEEEEGDEEINCVSTKYMQALYDKYMLVKSVRCARDIWLNVLLRHFRIEENCGISFQCDFRNYVTAPQRSVFVAHVVNMAESSIEGATRVVITMLEDGGSEHAAGEQQNAHTPFREPNKVAWKHYTDEVTEYVLNLRDRMTREGSFKENILYVITIAGMLAKFYALDPDSGRLMDCSGTNGEYFDVIEDISAIDEIAEELAIEAGQSHDAENSD